MIHRISLCVVLAAAMLSFGQANTWTVLNNDLLTGAGHKNWASLVYCADTNRWQRHVRCPEIRGWEMRGHAQDC
jgi:hypothetical protein